MNRRDLLKAGTALASLTWAERVLERCQLSTLNAQAPRGTLSIVFHGLSLLVFAPNGATADVTWLAFEREAKDCDVPVHLPVLSIGGSTRCLTKPNERSWRIAGLNGTPAGIVAAGSLDAPTYRDVAARPLDHPTKEAEWASLKWIPMLKGAVDREQLRSLRIASVSLNTGTLRAIPPRHLSAQTMLWSLETPNGVNSRAGSLAGLPEQALTDQVRYSVPFAGATVKLQFTPLLGGQSFDFEFASSNRQVELRVEADAGLKGELGPIIPVGSYCAYSQVVTPRPSLGDRVLPYYRRDFPGVSPAKGGPIGAMSPDPFCGSIRAILR